MFIFGFEGRQLCPIYLPYDSVSPTCYLCSIHLCSPSISANSLSSTIQSCWLGVVPPRTLLNPWPYLHSLRFLPKLPHGPFFPGPHPLLGPGLYSTLHLSLFNPLHSGSHFSNPISTFAGALFSCGASNLSVLLHGPFSSSPSGLPSFLSLAPRYRETLQGPRRACPFLHTLPPTPHFNISIAHCGFGIQFYTLNLSHFYRSV